MIYRKRKDAQVLDIYNINSDSFLKMPGTKNWLTKGEDEIFYNERERVRDSEGFDQPTSIQKGLPKEFFPWAYKLSMCDAHNKGQLHQVFAIEEPLSLDVGPPLHTKIINNFGFFIRFTLYNQ